MYGISRLVTPPPRLPQPADVALAMPTTDLLYICTASVERGRREASKCGGKRLEGSVVRAARGGRVLAHLGAPDLRADEGGKGEADDHAADDPGPGILHEHNAEDGRTGDPQQKRDATARAQDVANDTGRQQDPREVGEDW